MARVLTENQKKGLAYEAWTQMQLENLEYKTKNKEQFENLATHISRRGEFLAMCATLEALAHTHSNCIKTITTVNFTPDKELCERFFDVEFYNFYAETSWKSYNAKITIGREDTKTDYKIAVIQYHESIKDRISKYIVLPYKNLDEKEVAMRAQVLSIKHTLAEELLAAIYEDCKNTNFVNNEITYKRK